MIIKVNLTIAGTIEIPDVDIPLPLPTPEPTPAPEPEPTPEPPEPPEPSGALHTMGYFGYNQGGEKNQEIGPLVSTVDRMISQEQRIFIQGARKIEILAVGAACEPNPDSVIRLGIYKWIGDAAIPYSLLAETEQYYVNSSEPWFFMPLKEPVMIDMFGNSGALIHIAAMFMDCFGRYWQDEGVMNRFKSPEGWREEGFPEHFGEGSFPEEGEKNSAVYSLAVKCRVVE